MQLNTEFLNFKTWCLNQSFKSYANSSAASFFGVLDEQYGARFFTVASLETKLMTKVRVAAYLVTKCTNINLRPLLLSDTVRYLWIWHKHLIHHLTHSVGTNFCRCSIDSAHWLWHMACRLLHHLSSAHTNESLKLLQLVLSLGWPQSLEWMQELPSQQLHAQP